MSALLPPFLAHLGLDGQADEKAVRRAYARALKLIDQQHQADEFQQLRQAYEAALAWCRARLDAATAPDTSSPAAAESAAETASESAPTPPPWFVAARAAGQDFLQAVQQHAARPEATRIESWESLLQHALADARLEDLRARPVFEHEVAALLLRGWQAGHEYLFVAALRCFDWERDRQRLQQMGPAGWQLDRAILQYHDFLQLESAQQARLRRSMARLRDPQLPATAIEFDRLDADIPALLTRYPEWVPVVTSPAQLTAWQQQAERPARNTAASAALKAATQGKKKRWTWGPWSIFAVALMVIKGLLFLAEASLDTSGTPGMPQGAAQSSYQSRISPPTVIREPKIDYQPADAAMAAALSRDIKRYINYAIPPGLVGNPEVQFTLRIDGRGALTWVERNKSSGLPDFDEAVRRGIERAQPYPVNAPREMIITFRPK